MVNNVPQQGDIIRINLDPKQEHEQKGYRPYICLSHHLVSDYANICRVCADFKHHAAVSP
jgi:mRNA-degrading endonuclease toxin of MazEF toxin-antitoxin module